MLGVSKVEFLPLIQKSTVVKIMKKSAIKILHIHHQLIMILRGKIESNSADKKQNKDRKVQTISSNFFSVSVFANWLIFG